MKIKRRILGWRNVPVFAISRKIPDEFYISRPLFSFNDNEAFSKGENQIQPEESHVNDSTFYFHKIELQ